MLIYWLFKEVDHTGYSFYMIILDDHTVCSNGMFKLEIQFGEAKSF